jgi:hypothetical protein
VLLRTNCFSRPRRQAVLLRETWRKIAAMTGIPVMDVLLVPVIVTVIIIPVVVVTFSIAMALAVALGHCVLARNQTEGKCSAKHPLHSSLLGNRGLNFTTKAQTGFAKATHGLCVARLTWPLVQVPQIGMDEPAAGGPAAFQEQLLKSISATFVVLAGNAFKGCAVMSFAVVSSDGIQSGVPPLRGTAARASTVNSTSPVAGTE